MHVSESTAGGPHQSDRGHTLMHISYDHDVDSMLYDDLADLLFRCVELA